MLQKNRIVASIMALIVIVAMSLTLGYAFGAGALHTATIPNGVVLAQASTTPAAPLTDLGQLYAQANPSVVTIDVTMGASGNQRVQNFGAQGEGSGFVYDTQGHIITNNHVVEGATSIEVTFSNDVSRPAQVVGTDPGSDLAVIKVDMTGLNITPLTLGDSDAVTVGQAVAAIGSPFGLPGSLSTGIVSATGRLMPVDGRTGTAAGRYSIPDVIQTDAAINPGNSGGPLLNMQGQVIGVNSAIESAVSSNAGVGFAIPANIVKKVAPALISKGSYDHPWLGISALSLNTDVNQALGLTQDQRGVLVAQVAAGSPAEKAGLKAGQGTATVQGNNIPTGGDVIVSIDGHQVSNFDSLIGYLERNTAVGQTVQLGVLRGGQTVQVSVTLAARPSNG